MIEDARKKLDSIDSEIRVLLLKRIGLCKEIGRYKRAHDIRIEDLEREDEIISRLSEGLDPEMSALMSEVYNSIFKHAKSVM